MFSLVALLSTSNPPAPAPPPNSYSLDDELLDDLLKISYVSYLKALILGMLCIIYACNSWIYVLTFRVYNAIDSICTANYIHLGILFACL